MNHWRFIPFAVVFIAIGLLGMPASVAATSPALMPPADGFLAGCTGEYFNNTTLSGSPVLVRTDGSINFTWGQGVSPGPGVAVDNYSVRWTCTVNAPSSNNYTFTMTTDDGMNLIVDGNLLVWAFYDQGPTTYTGTIYLNAGTHTVKVEYYNKVNAGTAQVSSPLGTGSGSVYIPPAPVYIPPAPAPAPVYSSSSGYLSSCTGEYFNNIDLSGSPAVVRTDGAVNFFWGEGSSPAGGINTTYYSVRWTCSVNAPTSNNYSFTMTTDDGMNLLVDGSLVVWAWYDQGPSTYTGTVYLNAGTHTVKVEYYNKVNAGTARVTSSLGSGGSVPPPSSGNWYAEYFNNQTLSGTPTVTRNESSINFNWGGGSPDPAIPADHFSARWTSTVYLNAGTWRFTAASDDGVRVWVDGTLLIDKWFDHSYVGYNADISLGAGNHTIRVEYYEGIGAGAVALAYGQLGGGAPPPPPPVSSFWHGQYFNNINLAGSPSFVRDDAALNFNWGEGVPVPGLPADYWSAKWDSVQNFPSAGNYTISATSDDGVRVWMDGALILDGWFDHGPTTFSATPYIGAGAHSFHVEYFDRTFGAMINVQVGGSGGSLPPPPPPSTGAEVIVDDQGVGWQAGGYSPWYATLGLNGHAFWALNHTYTILGYNWARWSPTLTGPGNYEVFAYIPAGYGSTLYARYWVRHGNRYDLAVRPQGFSGNQWMSLGTYYFSAAGGEYVSLADVTYECYACRRVAFDAIKFTPR